MACNICNELFEDGDAKATTSCCAITYHTECFVENLMAQRFNNIVRCTCGAALSHDLYPHPSDVEELPTTTEFTEAFQACNKKVPAMKTARREINRQIFLKRSHFKTMIQPHVAAIKAIKAQINAEIMASAAMKSYKSCVAKVRYAVSKLSADFTISQRSINMKILEWRSWRLNPSNRLRRALNCRV